MVIGRTPAGVEIAAWVLKASPTVFDVESVLAAEGVVDRWSVREGYRTRLMDRGQRCMLWLSGPRAAFIAAGHITGPAYSDRSDPEQWLDRAKARTAVLFVPVELRPIAEPVAKAELKGHPDLCATEFFRCAHGSNPSFLTSEELAALDALLES